MEPLWLVLVVVVAVALLWRAAKVVPAGHVFLTERLGRHRAILEPGVHLIIPAVDTIRAKLDTREQVLSKTREPVITRDDIVVLIDVVVFYEITDPRAAVYEVADYVQAFDQLTVTTLRNMIGGMDLADALTSRAVASAELRRVLSWTTGTWGIRVNRVDVAAMDRHARTEQRNGTDTDTAR